MKKLEKEFTGNFDRVGNTRFKQVKRTKDVAMYRREHMNGEVKSYEVFLVKTRKKGDKLPNGAVEKEDRECYPGTSAFGRIAYDCKTEAQAEARYDELIERAKDLQEAQEESIKTGKRIKVSRKKKVDIQLPNGKFTMKMLVAETGMTQPVLYLYLQNLIKQGLVREVDRVRVEGQRGKASVVYSSV
jgi:hypothetical protein